LAAESRHAGLRDLPHWLPRRRPWLFVIPIFLPPIFLPKWTAPESIAGKKMQRQKNADATTASFLVAAAKSR
jgi:hypothetical protein